MLFPTRRRRASGASVGPLDGTDGFEKEGFALPSAGSGLRIRDDRQTLHPSDHSHLDLLGRERPLYLLPAYPTGGAPATYPSLPSRSRVRDTHADRDASPAAEPGFSSGSIAGAVPSHRSNANAPTGWAGIRGGVRRPEAPRRRQPPAPTPARSLPGAVSPKCRKPPHLHSAMRGPAVRPPGAPFARGRVGPAPARPGKTPSGIPGMVLSKF